MHDEALDIRINDGRKWSDVKKEILSFIKDFKEQHDLRTFTDDGEWNYKGESAYYDYDYWYNNGRNEHEKFIFANSNQNEKKYSIDIDDSLFDALQDTYSVQEQEIASIVQEGFASLKNVTVNEKVMHKVAYDIKKEYQSKYDIDKLQENLTRVFAYLKDHADSVGYEDMVRIVQEISKPVIEQSTDVDAFEQEKGIVTYCIK